MGLPLLERVENACHISKQIVAVVCGVAYGAMPAVGAGPFFVFLLLMFSASYFTHAVVYKMDVDAEAQLELVKEGASPAIALFLLLWICVYTFVHVE